MWFKKTLVLKIGLLICVVWLSIQLILYNFFDQHTWGWFRWAEKITGPTMTGSTGFGDMGRAVNLPSKLQADAQATFSKHQFNLVVSDLIGLKRNLPNYRDARCTNLEPSSKLTAWKTSIIIVFHNEAWSTLLRTVHSVIDRTPRGLLEEIILVDDASTDGRWDDDVLYLSHFLYVALAYSSISL
ncbi:hypothetical protein PHET_09314 [Paragonimus heterotremus]|uniref:Glycosyltransferase 2-like domain-containing protein n=1 Tax=Paragonimus heterotremus TaxID=100268 RepID=A0A8J4T2L4_9TREM|nr:hypothetical protein PHET_09314 [Paragonimus heterotremus]